jgi:hypothetical protein
MTTRLLALSATAIALVDSPLPPLPLPPLPLLLLLLPLLHPVKQANATNTAMTTIAIAARREIVLFRSGSRIVFSLALICFEFDSG